MTTALIQNANLLDVRAGEILPDRWLAIENELIVDIGEGHSAFSAERLIDARGLTLTPGLIDSHVHAFLTSFNIQELRRKPMTLLAHEGGQILEGMLARGFTTVRDAAGADWGLAQAIERDLIQGPRLFFVGRALSQTGGHGDARLLEEDPPVDASSAVSNWLAHIVDGVPAVLAAARAELRRGGHHVKIMASGGVATPTDPLMSVQFSAEEMRAACGVAEDFGTYAMAHAYSPEAIRRAVEAGVRTIEHGNFLDDETAVLMAERGAFLVPTLVTYHTMHEIGRQAGFPEVSLAKTLDVLDAGLESLETAQRHGVEMAFGTDLLGVAHAQQNREFELRAEVMSPLDLIRAATLSGARILGQVGHLGEIVPGAQADILLWQGDPLRDVQVLARPEASLRLVMKAGRVFHDRINN